MTLTTAQRLRLKIADNPRYVDETRYGDGTASSFVIPYLNLANPTAFIPGAGASSWSATAATFNASGYVSFSGVISANSAFRYTLEASTFSDTEIQDFLDVGGTVIGAAVEAVGTLLFDATKAASWGAADGSTYSNTTTQQHLRELYKLLQQELEREAVFAGGFSSWSVNQENS
jgi:hypothetical protein